MRAEQQQLKHTHTEEEEQHFISGYLHPVSVMSQPGQEVEEHLQRPQVREEDLTEAKGNLGGGGAVKSKTFEVMEECEKVGKVAPSVFSSVRSGAETVLNMRSAQPIRK